MTNLKKISEIIKDKSKQTGKSIEDLSGQLEDVYRRFIPARFFSAEIDKMNKEIQNFIFNFDRILSGCNGLYLYGECGTGKTYAFYAMQKVAIANELKFKIFNATTLLNKIRSGFNKNSENDNFLEEISEMGGILAIDDIGSEKLTDWVGETFYSIINTRYERMLPTFFSSNLSLPELAEKMGDRIDSRIAEMCQIIKLSGKDLRICKK